MGKLFQQIQAGNFFFRKREEKKTKMKNSYLLKSNAELSIVENM
jgi:stalled ribosome alternative rescue factor ArfA